METHYKIVLKKVSINWVKYNWSWTVTNGQSSSHIYHPLNTSVYYVNIHQHVITAVRNIKISWKHIMHDQYCTLVNMNMLYLQWLLEIGADFHRRCYGNFFTCDDQKSSRRDNKTYEVSFIYFFNQTRDNTWQNWKYIFKGFSSKQN